MWAHKWHIQVKILWMLIATKLAEFKITDVAKIVTTSPFLINISGDYIYTWTKMFCHFCMLPQWITKIFFFFFLQKIDSYLNLSKEIASLHITVPLNMLCLNCDDVNQELSARAARLADRMIQYVVDQNRDKNRGYELHSVPFYPSYSN